MADFSGAGGRRDWVPAVVAVVMLVAVLALGGIWAVNTLTSTGGGGDSADESVRMPVGGEGAPTDDGEPVDNPDEDGDGKGGSGDSALTLVLTSADASCAAPPGIDTAGEPVSYEPAAAIDADDGTAWRCGATARG